GHCPHPTLPPQAGEGAGSRREGTGHAPSPACGGGPGWGPLQIAALNGLASDIAPIPTFPRKRGKGPVHGEKIQTAPPPPLAGAGGGSGRAGPGPPPSPACGGGPGWGPLQIAALNGLASDIAPIPTFPRKRGKGPVHGEKIQTAPPPPLAGEGRGGGRFRSP